MRLITLVIYVKRNAYRKYEITVLRPVNIEDPPIICNLRYKQQNFIPAIFHNGSGYDFNLYADFFKQNNDKSPGSIPTVSSGRSQILA